MKTKMKTITKTKTNKKQKTPKQQQQLTTAGRVGARGRTPPNTKGDILDIKTRKTKTTKNTATPTTQSLHFAITATTILALLTLLTPLTHADASLGSTFSTDNIKLSPGQQKIIEITFFNTGSTDINLLIEQITPIKKTSQVSDIKAYIMQEKNNRLTPDSTLTLESIPATKTPKKDTDTTWVVLGEKGDLYVPAKKVYLLIKVPNKQTYANDIYSLTFRASTQITGTTKDSTTASIGQIREFPLTVTIQNIVSNPKYADETSPPAPAKKTYTSLTKTTTSNLPEPANNQKQQDTNDNYINNNYIPKDDTTKNNPSTGTKNINSTQVTNTTILNTETQDTNLKDHITGLATANTSPAKTPYDILTIIIILIGAFIIYRIARH